MNTFTKKLKVIVNKPLFLYLMAFMYISLGIVHMAAPRLYLAVMPAWLPFKLFLIYASGVAEMLLGGGLIPVKTRILSAKLIVAMLIVFFFMIHIPQSIDYYITGNKYFIITLIRLPVQFLLIAWAWIYAKPTLVYPTQSVSEKRPNAKYS